VYQQQQQQQQQQSNIYNRASPAMQIPPNVGSSSATTTDYDESSDYEDTLFTMDGFGDDVINESYNYNSSDVINGHSQQLQQQYNDMNYVDNSASLFGISPDTYVPNMFSTSVGAHNTAHSFRSTAAVPINTNDYRMTNMAAPIEPLSWSQQSFFSSPHNSPTKNGGAPFMNGPISNSYMQNRRSSAVTGPLIGSYNYGPADFYQQQPLPPTNYHSAASYNAAAAMSNPEFSSGVRLMHGASFSRGQQQQQQQQVLPPTQQVVPPPEVSISDFDKEVEETRRKNSNEPDLRKVSINELDRRQNLTNR